jgi:phosphoglycolate phosphatase-like HAD superfamily hydrolase
MIRVVVFDFDGTLVESNRVKEVCLHRTVAGLCGGEAALAAARKTGGDRYQIFEDVARKLSTTSDLEAIASQTRVLINTYSHCCAMGIIAAAERRGARRALAGLSQRGLRIWVLSATPDRYLTDLLRRRGLLRWLRGSYGSSVSKEQGLRQIICTERANRNNVLFVGDGPDDQRAARVVGVKFAAVMAETRLEARGRFAIRDLRPLMPLIAYLNGKRRIGT